MVKELIYRFKDNSEIEVIINRLEEEVDEEFEQGIDEGVTSYFHNNNRSLEIHVFPRNSGELFEASILTRSSEMEIVTKKILGAPIKERFKDASILDVAELIAELPEDTSDDEIQKAIENNLGIKKKYSFFRRMIKKMGKKKNAPNYLRDAARKLE
ncbi:MAG: hypothetical protein EU542_06650 [Promethearchaeota archaeon]|nr:MAG: hypothetical protein EU542_06650 [Candidatus Lokiarchaeota archaeon]